MAYTYLKVILDKIFSESLITIVMIIYNPFNSSAGPCSFPTLDSLTRATVHRTGRLAAATERHSAAHFPRHYSSKGKVTAVIAVAAVSRESHRVKHMSRAAGLYVSINKCKI